MEQKEQIAAKLLYNRECPVGYKCLATDCMECLKIYMEKGAADGKEESYFGCDSNHGIDRRF